MHNPRTPPSLFRWKTTGDSISIEPHIAEDDATPADSHSNSPPPLSSYDDGDDNPYTDLDRKMKQFQPLPLPMPLGVIRPHADASNIKIEEGYTPSPLPVCSGLCLHVLVCSSLVFRPDTFESQEDDTFPQVTATRSHQKH
jgi:hypothetical protein